MAIERLRHVFFGSERDVRDPRIFERITVGAVAAWIAMGGDLLGSCVYGPDVLGRSSGPFRSVLLISGGATLATLALLAYAYTRMVAQFPHGGGGYTAAKHVVSERLALVSGVALVIDAAFDVAVSVVTCVHAAADALPSVSGALKLPVALLLVVLLAFVNLRGVKESVTLLAPILLIFVASHLLVLGLGIAHRLPEFRAAFAGVPSDLQGLATEKGTPGALLTVARAYALGGAIYTGLESISNGVPILQEPKVKTARRTMLLLAGIPALVIASILVGYFLYDVRAEPDKTVNAVLFERVASAFGAEQGALRTLVVTVPLLSEAALLIVAAQTGFVDGPRILGALATDRFLPRRLTRLNRRLAPAPGIILIAAVAVTATLVVGATLAPLLAVFVTSVFVTFSISQWAMLRHAIARRKSGSPWRSDAVLHGVALLLCCVILAGTIDNWRVGSSVALLLIGGVVAVALAIRRRYVVMAEAVAQAGQDLAPSAMRPEAPPHAGAPIERAERLEPIAVLMLGERAEFGRLALEWLAHMPAGLSCVILASVSLVDAEAVQGEERLRELEEQRRNQLESVATEARRFGVPVRVEMRRGADVLETATALVVDLMRNRPLPSVVVGFRSGLDSSALDPLLRDDLAVGLQARLKREGVAMVVVSIPLKA